MAYAIFSYMKYFDDEADASKWLIETYMALNEKSLLDNSLALNGFGSFEEDRLQSLCKDL